MKIYNISSKEGKIEIKESIQQQQKKNNNKKNLLIILP